jgi:hypothetical protein
VAVEITENAVEQRIAEFNDQIAEWRKSYDGSEWAKATEEEKLHNIFWEACAVSDGTTVPGTAVLAAIERNIDYAGLPPAQGDMLNDLRRRLDAGKFSGSLAEEGDTVGTALSRIVDAGFLEEALREAKESADKLWSEIPEDRKVRRIIGMALDSGVWADWEYDGLTPGGHVLATIEREVDYTKLAPWRREGLVSLRARLDASELDGESPICSDRGAGYALRMAELEADIEDGKHFGATVQRPVEIAWAELTEAEKLDSIERAIVYLGLDGASKPVDIICREVNLDGVPDDRRQRALERRDDDDWEPDETRPALEMACKEAEASLGSDIVQRARQAAGERREQEGCEQAPEHPRDRER